MKLVRDKIPEIIKRTGKVAHTRSPYSDAEYSLFLRHKLSEEGDEFLETPTAEEAADIYEVLRAMCDLNSISIDEVVSVADKKRDERGGFSGRIVLEKISDDAIRIGTMVTPNTKTSYLLPDDQRPTRGDVGIVVNVRTFIDYNWMQYEVSFSGDKIGWYFESELDILEEEISEETNE